MSPFHISSLGVATISKNVAVNIARLEGKRSLDSILAHEFTHLDLRDKLGFLSQITLPDWIDEGIAEYIANQSTIDEQKAIQYLLEMKSPPDERSDIKLSYFYYRACVSYLVEVKNLNLQQILGLTDFNIYAEHNKLLIWLKSKSSLNRISE